MQLYEQILAENEKLKAQLRDTDMELADLKLQLEKATQVRLSCRDQHGSAPYPVISDKLFLTLCVSAEAGALCRSIPAGDGEKGNYRS